MTPRLRKGGDKLSPPFQLKLLGYAKIELPDGRVDAPLTLAMGMKARQIFLVTCRKYLYTKTEKIFYNAASTGFW